LESALIQTVDLIVTLWVGRSSLLRSRLRLRTSEIERMAPGGGQGWRRSWSRSLCDFAVAGADSGILDEWLGLKLSIGTMAGAG
jgi:hypothetical protein